MQESAAKVYLKCSKPASSSCSTFSKQKHLTCTYKIQFLKNFKILMLSAILFNSRKILDPNGHDWPSVSDCFPPDHWPFGDELPSSSQLWQGKLIWRDENKQFHTKTNANFLSPILPLQGVSHCALSMTRTLSFESLCGFSVSDLEHLYWKFAHLSSSPSSFHKYIFIAGNAVVTSQTKFCSSEALCFHFGRHNTKK